MANAKAFFFSVTQRIFSNWTALKMAVEHGMGSKERAMDFCSYIVEVMYMNDDLNSSVIANELDDYMEEQFRTELQDNSDMQVAEELLRFYRYCIENNESLAMAELEKLPPLQSWIVSNEPLRRTRNPTNQESDDSSESEEESDGGMKVVEDDWVEVRIRRKR